MSIEPGLVTVIILNHNKKEDTLNCIRSVLQFTYTPFKILVVDNGSQDGSYESISKTFPQIETIHSPENLGAPGGRNFGLAHASFDHEYVLFLDNDTVVQADLLSHLVEALRADRTVGIACPKTYQEFPSTTLMSCGMYVNLTSASIFDIGSGELDQGQYEEPRYVPACGAFGFLIRRDLAVQLEGFDQRYNPYGWGEIDLCLRARQQGFKVRYVPQGVMYHKGGKIGRGQVAILERYKVRNFFRLMEQHATLKQWAGCLLSLPFRILPRLIKTFQSKSPRAVITAQFRGLKEWVLRQ